MIPGCSWINPRAPLDAQIRQRSKLWALLLAQEMGGEALPDSGFRIQDSGFRISGVSGISTISGFRIQDLKTSGFKTSGLRDSIRVQFSQKSKIIETQPGTFQNTQITSKWLLDDPWIILDQSWQLSKNLDFRRKFAKIWAGSCIKSTPGNKRRTQEAR